MEEFSSYLVRPPSVCQRLWIPLALLTFFEGHYFMPRMSNLPPPPHSLFHMSLSLPPFLALIPIRSTPSH